MDLGKSDKFLCGVERFLHEEVLPRDLSLRKWQCRSCPNLDTPPRWESADKGVSTYNSLRPSHTPHYRDPHEPQKQTPPPWPIQCYRIIADGLEAVSR